MAFIIAKEWDSQRLYLLPQVMKSPPTSFFIKKAIGKDKGSGRTGHEKAGQIPVSHIYEIALIKQADLKDIPLQSICKSIVASCRSMGVEVVQGS